MEIDNIFSCLQNFLLTIHPVYPTWWSLIAHPAFACPQLAARQWLVFSHAWPTTFLTSATALWPTPWPPPCVIS